VDVFVTLLARPKAAIVDAAESGADVSNLVGFTVEVTNREGAIRGLLDFFQLIGASLNLDTVAEAD
jgi:hypothetical protein